MIWGICYPSQRKGITVAAMEENRKKGKLKFFGMMFLFLVMAYFGVHVYFIWQPVGRTENFAQQVMDANVAGVKLFPAIENYDLAKIDGRAKILAGRELTVSPIPDRLAYAIKRNGPVTFQEEEVNTWLRKRLDVKQRGLLAGHSSIQGVWVNFQPGEVELIIERKLAQGQIYVVSLFMKFEASKNGFTIDRHASQVGQVKVPGGFARLVVPAFSQMAEELSEELKLYKDDELTSDKALKIHDVVVEDGRITFDPRLKGQERM